MYLLASNKVAIPCLLDILFSSCLIPLQQFIIHLAAHVTQQYPLPEDVGVAKDILYNASMC